MHLRGSILHVYCFYTFVLFWVVKAPCHCFWPGYPWLCFAYCMCQIVIFMPVVRFVMHSEVVVSDTPVAFIHCTQWFELMVAHSSQSTTLCSTVQWHYHALTKQAWQEVAFFQQILDRDVGAQSSTLPLTFQKWSFQSHVLHIWTKIFWQEDFLTAQNLGCNPPSTTSLCHIRLTKPLVYPFQIVFVYISACQQ